MARVTFSQKNVDVADFALHHSDLENAVREYFNMSTRSYISRFAGYTSAELAAELETRLVELDMASSLTILSAVEAILRIDYLQRCYQRGKDPLSRAFRDLHKRKGSKVNLEDEILDLWRLHTNGGTQFIGELKGAFKYRHWLAHG